MHEATPGRPALPGTDPSATAPAMAVGASLPGGPSTGPLPVPTGESLIRGLRTAIAERLAKAKSMTSTNTRDSSAAPTATVPRVSRNGASAPAAVSTPPVAPGAAAVPVARSPAVSGHPHGPPAGQPQADGSQLAPFAGAPPAPGGPAPVVAPPGFSAAAVVGPGAAVVAGAALGMAAAGTATASSATVTGQTATLGSAPTTVLPQVPPTAPGPPRRQVKPARPPRKPKPSKAAAGRRPGLRRAHLKLTRVDPWTVMKISFMLAIAFGIMTVVSVFVIWSMLDTAGVFTAIADSVNSVTGDSEGAGVNLLEWVALDRVLGFATLLAVVDIVLITALSTLFAFLYNLASTLLGGVEVTFVEDHR